jgi:hypothetical protein
MMGDTVKAKVRALNLIGWSDYSNENAEGATIIVEPHQLSTPTRGFETSET